jgi:hypothetical protein
MINLKKISMKIINLQKIIRDKFLQKNQMQNKLNYLQKYIEIAKAQENNQN